MKKKQLFFKPLIVFITVIAPSSLCYSQSANKTNCGLSKEYSIMSAQLAEQSYTFSKLAYSVNDPNLIEKNIDTSFYFIQQAITAMDSAIFFAADTDLLALDYANISKKEAIEVYNKLKLCKASEDIRAKQAIAKEATFLSAHSVVDAYHSSFYFTGCTEDQNKEVADSTAGRQVAKLDVDQSLFTLLEQSLNEQLEKTDNELSKLQAQLKTEKDPAKIAQIKKRIKELMANRDDLIKKKKDAQDKLSKINSQIDERNKNGKNGSETPSVFAKSMKASNWSNPFIMDSGVPSGLVYQVQIGVYKNPIKPEVFRGLTPIFGQTVSKGITYSSGLFEHYSDALQAMEYIRSVGLNDAFVIAYFNKKKITLAEAQKLEKK